MKKMPGWFLVWALMAAGIGYSIAQEEVPPMDENVVASDEIKPDEEVTPPKEEPTLTDTEGKPDAAQE